MTELLTELFDEGYTAVNINPKTSVPQMFLINDEGIENLIVNIVAIDESTARGYRALRPTDKNIAVLVMTLVESGGRTYPVELKGGLGANPAKTLATIFNTVYQNINHTIVESIAFRFQRKRLKGKEGAVERIIGRMFKQKTGGKFKLADELEDISKGKYTLIIGHKSKVKVEDLPPIEVYERPTDREIMKKMKISKSAIAKVQYSFVKWSTLDKYTKTVRKYYDEIESKDVQRKSTPEGEKTSKTEFDKVVKNIENDKRLVGNDNVRKIFSSYGVTNTNRITYYVEEIQKKINTITPQNSYEVTSEIIKMGMSMIGDQGHDVKKTAQFVKQLLLGLNDTMSDNFAKMAPKQEFTHKQAWAVRVYADEGYAPVNKFLIGRGENTPRIYYKEIIPFLDEAFENGVSLPKGTKLYRSESLPGDLLNAAVESQHYYFKNYVSTSITPIIFASFDEASYPSTIMAKMDVNEEAKFDDSQYNVGWVFHNADTIKTIVPGKMSKYPHECEVILPRGLMVKITKSSIGSDNYAALLECEIVDAESLDEGTIVYDGDALMQEGVVRFSDMYKE